MSPAVRKRARGVPDPVVWLGDRVRILDQTRLPVEERYLEARTPEAIARAIRTLAVRGAPLLGIAAGYGVALAAATSRARTGPGVLGDVRRAAALLVASRPTAVNIPRAVRRTVDAAGAAGPSPASIRSGALAEAHRIAQEEREACREIGRLGASLIPDGADVLTHCNTGVLATGGIGTAQGVITSAVEAGRSLHVWVGETRPVLQGARLTAWELQRAGVPMTLVADAAAGSLMARGLVSLVVVGADRIAWNGDTANKVGTYQLAILARHHRIPFYVAAPVSTVDLATPDGAAVVVEERDPNEVIRPFGSAFAPAGTVAANPAFDVTPGGSIDAIVTGRGGARPPYRSSLRRLAGGSA